MSSEPEADPFTGGGAPSPSGEPDEPSVAVSGTNGVELSDMERANSIDSQQASASVSRTTLYVDAVAELANAGGAEVAAVPGILEAAAAAQRKEDYDQLVEAATVLAESDKAKKGWKASTAHFRTVFKNMRLDTVADGAAQAARGRVRLSEDQKLQLAGRLLEYRSSKGQTFQEKLAEELLAHGVELPTITVQYDNFSVATNAKVAGSIDNVGSTIASKFKPKEPKRRKVLLESCTGVLRPGRATLLVGPPGGGKSVFMKALTGRLKNKQGLDISGSLLYNGHTQDEFVIGSSSAYVEQIDNHFPTLTVRETLEFAKKCQRGTGEGSVVKNVKKLLDVRRRKRGLQQQQIERQGGDSLKSYPSATDFAFESLLAELDGSGPVVVDYVLKLMGIDGCQNTVVGDAMLRGVSGGQKKRVTTAEMLVGFNQLIMMDEISTGLDSATTFQVALFITNYTHAMSSTTVVGLLQPPPETVALFDDIMIVADGHIVYHGPTRNTLPFFQTLGFTCPPRKDIGSFLQEVFTPQGQLEYCSEAMRDSKRGKDMDGLLMPVEDIKAAFNVTEVGQAAVEGAKEAFDRSKSHPEALRKTKYALSPFEAFRVLLARQALLLQRNTNLLYTRAGFAVVTGLILGTVFFQLQPNIQDSRSYFGLFYLICMFFALGNFPQVSIAYNAKSNFYKHKNNNFFPAFVYVLVQMVIHIPFAFFESLVFTICLYFLSGLSLDGGQYFFIFWLIAFSMHNTMAAMFRFIANISTTLVSASSTASIALLINILTSGYTIVFGSIPPWWIWLYWLSPFAYAIRAFVINEMTSPRWGPTGLLALVSFDFQTENFWIWAGVGFQWAFTAAMVLGSGLVLTLFDTRSAHEVSIADKQRDQAIVQAKTDLKRAKLQLKEIARQSKHPNAPSPRRPDRPADANASDLTIEIDQEEQGAKLPFPSVTLVWKDLRYIVKTPAGAKLELLKGISGFARPRRLTALMGGSGAGKTTLMDVISGRKTQGEIKGELLVNGEPKNQGAFARCMGYVEQTDIHSPMATIREALQFSAALRLPSTTSALACNGIVQETLKMVELEYLQESLVGVPGVSGLTNEQRKRLTIAVELVSNPSVVFLDEPTSGLDSTAARTVVRAMRSISEAGRTVMATIHQPSVEIFSAFDALVLLKRGGRLIFFGELGENSCKLIKYLQAQPHVEPINDGYNPATWMLEVSGGEVEVEGKQLDFADLYEISELRQANDKELEDELLASRSKPKLVVDSTSSATLNMQFYQLMKKNFRTYWRSPSYNITRMIVVAIMALMYGSIYWQQGSDITATEISQSRVQNLLGVIFSSITFVAVFQLTAIQPIVAFERSVYTRESAAEMYSVWPQSLSRTLVEIPFLVMQTLIFVPILYFMVGFVTSADKFFFYLLVNFISLSLFTFFGEWLIYVTPNQQLAQVFGAGLNQVWNIMCGFLVAYPLIPVWWQWANRLTPSTWLIYALAADQMADSDAKVDGMLGQGSTLSEYMNENFGFYYSSRWIAVIISLAFVVFFRITSTLALRYINFTNR